MYTSPTLISHRSEELNPPPESTSCRTCPSAMWFVTPFTPPATKGNQEDEKVVTKCFCRVMHVLTWADDLPPMPAACDGQAIGLAQLKKEVSDQY